MRTVVLAFSALLLIGAFGAYYTIHEIFIKPPLFNASVTFVRNLQKGGDQDFTPVFFMVLNYLLSHVVLGPLLLFFFVFFSIHRQVMLLAAILGIATYGISLSKLFFGSPRPYMVDFQIHPWDFTAADYGDFSGNCALVIIIGIYFFYCLFLEDDYNDHEMRQMNADLLERGVVIAERDNDNPRKFLNQRALEISRIIYGFFMTVYMLLVCFGRMYLGASSIDQVLLGVLFGFTLIMVIMLIKHAIQWEFVEWTEDSGLKPIKLFFVVAFTVGALAFPHLPYLLFLHSNPQEASWRKQIQQYVTNTPNSILADKNYLDCTWLAMSMGILASVLLLGGHRVRKTLRFFDFRNHDNYGVHFFMLLIIFTPSIVLYLVGVFPWTEFDIIYLNYVFSKSAAKFLCFFTLLPAGYVWILSFGWGVDEIDVNDSLNSDVDIAPKKKHRNNRKRRADTIEAEGI